MNGWHHFGITSSVNEKSSSMIHYRVRFVLVLCLILCVVSLSTAQFGPKRAKKKRPPLFSILPFLRGGKKGRPEKVVKTRQVSPPPPPAPPAKTPLIFRLLKMGQKKRKAVKTTKRPQIPQLTPHSSPSFQGK